MIVPQQATLEPRGLEDQRSARHAQEGRIERPQWAVWRWTQKPDGNSQKPPFMATQPERYASTKDHTTWRTTTRRWRRCRSAGDIHLAYKTGRLAMSNQVIERKQNGQFAKGVSGNLG